jgi:hypothetical protein
MALNNSNQVGEAFIKVTAKMDPQSVQAAGNAIGTDLKAKAEQAGTAMEQAANKGESAFRRLFNSVRGGFGGIASNGFQSGFGGLGRFVGGLGQSGAEIGTPTPSTSQGILAGLTRLGSLFGIGATIGTAASFAIDRFTGGAVDMIRDRDRESAFGTARRSQDLQRALSDQVPGNENYYKVKDIIAQQNAELDQQAKAASDYLDSYTGGQLAAGLEGFIDAGPLGWAQRISGQNDVTEGILNFFGLETPSQVMKRIDTARRLQGVNDKFLEAAKQKDFLMRSEQSIENYFGQISGQTIGPGQSPDAAFADVNKTMLSVLAELKAINRNTQ